MSASLAIALYRPKEGKEKELLEVVKKHLPVLKEYGLVSDKTAYLAESANGTIIEVFEWANDNAKDAAHQHPAIAKIWEEMAPLAEFPSLRSLPEANRPFPNFKTLTLS